MIEEKRIYSLNLCSYLLSRNVMYIKIARDPETNCVYFVFPECGKFINDYRNDKELHNFLDKYREVRQLVSECQ